MDNIKIVIILRSSSFTYYYSHVIIYIAHQFQNIKETHITFKTTLRSTHQHV